MKISNELLISLPLFTIGFKSYPPTQSSKKIKKYTNMTEFPFKHLLQNNVNNYKDSIKINLGQPLLQQSVNHLLTSFEENMGLHQ